MEKNDQIISSRPLIIIIIRMNRVFNRVCRFVRRFIKSRIFSKRAGTGLKDEVLLSAAFRDAETQYALGLVK